MRGRVAAALVAVGLGGAIGLAWPMVGYVAVFCLILTAIAAHAIQSQIFRLTVESDGRPVRLLVLVHSCAALLLAAGLVALVGGWARGAPAFYVLSALSAAALAAQRLHEKIPLRVRVALVRALQGRLVKGRGPIWSVLAKLSRELARGDEVLVTSLEDAAVDYIEENEESKEFMETWQEKVKTLGINVKQVVRVFDNAADIANLENRISRYSSLPNVELGVLLSPALAPLLEVYIVRGQYAVLSFSTSAATPNSMTDSVVLDDKFAVQALERFFTETLWSSTEPLKTAFAVDDGVLAEMRRAVALVSETDKRVWRELPTLLARGGSIATDILHLISSLGDAAPALELQPAAKTMAGQIRDLTAAVRGMPAPGARYPNAFRAIDSVRPARSLEAVSLLDNEVYWMSPAGQSQMTLEAELCARGVSIRRVFIVPATSRLSTVMVEILRRQRGYAGDTSVVLIERNDAQLVVDGTLSDFAILDRAAVICDSGARVSRYSASEWVLTLSASFDLLFYEAGIRPQEIGSREVRRVATVVAVDTVSYSDAAALANEMLGQDALLMLDRQIQDLFSECLRGIGANVNASVLSRDGDGAKFVFDRPETAHAFAEAVHAAAARRNETRHDPRALRKFRIGAATGEIIVSASSEQKIDAAAGMAVTIAVRLEQAGEADTILIDDATYASLSAALQEYYGDEELVAGKRDEQFRVRRRRLEGQASRRAPDAQASQKLL